MRALFIVDANGLVTQNSNGPDTLSIDLSDRPIDLSDRAYFKAHAIDPDPSLRIGEPLISRALGTWFISLTRRIDNPDGSFGGIVVASIDPTYIQTFYRELKFGADDSINLFLRDGTLLARIPQPEQVIGLNFSSLDLFRTQLRSSQAGVYRAPSMITGTPRIIGYRAPDEYPIVVSVALGENEILAQWKSHLFSTIVAIGLVSTLVILLALF